MSNTALAQTPVLSTLGETACGTSFAGHSIAPASEHLELARRLRLLHGDFAAGRLPAIDLNAAVFQAIVDDPMVAYLTLSIGFAGQPADHTAHVLRRMLGAGGSQAHATALADVNTRLELDGGTPYQEPDMQTAYESALREALPPEEYARQIAALVDLFAGRCATVTEQYYLGQIIASAFATDLGYGQPGAMAGTGKFADASRAAKVLPLLETLGGASATSALAFLVNYGLEGYLSDAAPRINIPGEMADQVPVIVQAAAALDAAMAVELPLREAEMYE